jgi:hypothetical protein
MDVFVWQTLDKEVEKVVLFFLATQGDIASRLLELRLRMKAVCPTRDPSEAEEAGIQMAGPINGQINGQSNGQFIWQSNGQDENMLSSIVVCGSGEPDG